MALRPAAVVAAVLTAYENTVNPGVDQVLFQGMKVGSTGWAIDGSGYMASTGSESGANICYTTFLTSAQQVQITTAPYDNVHGDWEVILRENYATGDRYRLVCSAGTLNLYFNTTLLLGPISFSPALVNGTAYNIGGSAVDSSTTSTVLTGYITPAGSSMPIANFTYTDNPANLSNGTFTCGVGWQTNSGKIAAIEIWDAGREQMVSGLLSFVSQTAATYTAQIAAPSNADGTPTINVYEVDTLAQPAFDPLMFGTSNIDWYYSATAVVASGAAQFSSAGTITKLVANDSTYLQVNGGPITIGCLFTPTAIPATTGILVGKGLPRSNTNTEYCLFTDTDQKIHFTFGNGSTFTELTWPSKFLLNQPLNLKAGYDYTNGQVFLQSNLDTAVTAAWAPTPKTWNGTSLFNIGPGVDGTIEKAYVFLRLTTTTEDVIICNPNGPQIGGKYPGTLANGTTWSTNVPGVSPYSTYGHSANFTAANPAESITLSGPTTPTSAQSGLFWIYPTAISSGESCIVRLGTGTKGLYLFNPGSGLFGLDYYTGASHHSTLRGTLNQWNLVGWFNDGTTLSLTINNVIDGTTFSSLPVEAWVALGNDNIATGDEFQGQMGPCWLFNSLINSTTINSAYTGTTSTLGADCALKLNDNGAIQASLVSDSVGSTAKQPQGRSYDDLPAVLQNESTATFPFFGGLSEPQYSLRHDRKIGHHLYDANKNVTTAMGTTQFTPTQTYHALSQITDLSGHGRHSVPFAATTRATFVPASQAGGQPAIKFSSSGPYNTSGTAMSIPDTGESGACTVIMLFQLRYPPDSGGFTSLLTTTGSGKFSEIALENQGGYQSVSLINDATATGTSKGFSPMPDTRTDHMLVATFDGASAYAAFMDNLSQAIVTSGTLAQASPTAALGGRYASSTISNSTDFYLREAIKLNYALTDTNTLQFYTVYHEGSSFGLAPITAPSAPTLSRLCGATSIKLIVATPPTGTQTYSWYRRPHGSGSWTALAVNQTVPQWKDTTVVVGTAYDYKVTANNAQGSTDSNIISNVQTFQWPQAVSAGLVYAFEPDHSFQDAGLTTPATANGAAVLGRQDLSGNGHHWTSTTSNQATIVTNYFPSGQPGVVFNSATPTYGTITNGSGITVSDFAIGLMIGNTGTPTNGVWCGDGTNALTTFTNTSLSFGNNAVNTGTNTVPSPAVPMFWWSARSGTNWDTYLNTYHFVGPQTVAATTFNLTYSGTFGSKIHFLSGTVGIECAFTADIAVTNPALLGDVNYYAEDKYGVPGAWSFVIVITGGLGWNAAPWTEILADNVTLYTSAWQQTNATANDPSYIVDSFTYDNGSTNTPFRISYQNDDWTKELGGGLFQNISGTRLADGTLIEVILRDAQAGATVCLGYTRRSNDGGLTWGDPIPMQLSGSISGSGLPAGYTFCQPYGKIREVTPGGELLMPAYATATGHSGYNTELCLHSLDGGRTWSVKSIIAQDLTGANFYTEADLINSTGTTWLAAIRGQVSGLGGPISFAISTDGGSTWDTPTQPFSAETLDASPAWLKCASGACYLFYASRANPPQITVRKYLSAHNFASPLQVWVFVAGTGFDAGYPSPVQLSDNSIFVTFYGPTWDLTSDATSARSIHGVRFLESQIPTS